MIPPKLKKKICLLGSFGVGKTSLVERFVYNRFSEDYLSTIGVRVAQKDVTTGDKHPTLRMLIWDIEGVEAGNPVVKNYYTGAAAAIVVGDVTRPDTFSQISRLIQRFSAINPQAVLVLAANKSDLLPDPQSTEKAMKSIAREIGCDFYLTSAKDGSNVQEIFNYLYDKLIENV